MERSRVTHWLAPIAFLAAITVGALFIRAGFQQGKPNSGQTQTQTTTVTSKQKKHARDRQHRGVRTYIIQSGDTLAVIASKTGTTVARLEQLNHGIDPNALRIGQKIRVQ